VVRCTPGNAYILKTLLGEEFTATINGRYLKKYYPSIEIARQNKAKQIWKIKTDEEQKLQS
jgi:hypothetical protein